MFDADAPRAARICDRRDRHDNPAASSGAERAILHRRQLRHPLAGKLRRGAQREVIMSSSGLTRGSRVTNVDVTNQRNALYSLSSLLPWALGSRAETRANKESRPSAAGPRATVVE